MKRPRRAWMLIGGGVLAVAALVGAAAAACTDSSPARQTSPARQPPPVEQRPSSAQAPPAPQAPYAQEAIGTIPVDESTLPKGEAAERQALQRLAKIPKGDAEAAALRAVQGATVVESELETEDGFVVWEVDLAASDGTNREVNVDAGDGKVLNVEIDD